LFARSQKKKWELTLLEKYKLYEASVQDPAGEVETLHEIYSDIRKKKVAKSFREDFAGSAALCCAWVKKSSKHVAYGVDLDPLPLEYAATYHLTKLSPGAKKRIHLIEGNVLTETTPPVDLIAALNFSYFIFRERIQLLEYFKAAHKHLNKDGVLILDLFGGTDAQKVMEEVVDHDDFKYFWDCISFDPITHFCHFAIHFKRKKQKKMKNVFDYHWRLWSLPELRDLLSEAGFRQTIPYWEGDDGKGGGNGEFKATSTEENCLSWVAYIAAVK